MQVDETCASLMRRMPHQNLCKEAYASSLRLAPPDLKRSGSGSVSVYKWFIFGLFFVLSMFLIYLHDFILCFLYVINMILVIYCVFSVLIKNK